MAGTTAYSSLPSSDNFSELGDCKGVAEETLRSPKFSHRHYQVFLASLVSNLVLLAALLFLTVGRWPIYTSTLETTPEKLVSLTPVKNFTIDPHYTTLSEDADKYWAQWAGKRSWFIEVDGEMSGVAL